MNSQRKNAGERPSDDRAEAIDAKPSLGRLNRYVARAGVCSRRKADGLIDQGLVKVNGQVASQYWYRVQPSDTVHVNGKLITPRTHQYFLLNKPDDVISSVSDDRGRKTVMDLLPAQDRVGMFPVGRLDRDTTGLLILTNDGDLAHRLMHPSYCVTKGYVVTTKLPVARKHLVEIRSGVELEDGRAHADLAIFVTDKDRTCVGIETHSGRNRQVRRMFEALGYQVQRLDRISYAGLSKRGLKRGRLRKLTDTEIVRIRKLVRLY